MAQLVHRKKGQKVVFEPLTAAEVDANTVARLDKHIAAAEANAPAAANPLDGPGTPVPGKKPRANSKKK